MWINIRIIASILVARALVMIFGNDLCLLMRKESN